MPDVLQAHEDRNLARKLTPAEKKEKKLKKLVGEANEGDAPQVAVYKVLDLSNRQHQFKVRVNAQVSCILSTQAVEVTVAFSALSCGRLQGVRPQQLSASVEGQGQHSGEARLLCFKPWEITVRAASCSCAVALQVAVYKLSDISNFQHQFKVRVSAQVSGKFRRSGPQQVPALVQSYSHRPGELHFLSSEHLSR